MHTDGRWAFERISKEYRRAPLSTSTERFGFHTD
jgi:hypothetical protein